MIKGLFDFIKSSPTAYQTVGTVEKRLQSEGYVRLYEDEEFKIKEGGKYYVVRNGTSLIAFRIPKSPAGFMISATHSDSPAFRLKATEEKVGTYTRLDVERYGGMIYYSWLDRPLSVAGRVLVDSGDGVKSVPVNLDCDLVTIPSVAIHLNRSVNDGYKFNPATDLLPIYRLGDGEHLIETIAKEIGVKREQIISHDLFLYNREEPRLIGYQSEMILSPRLDDLECVYASVLGFLNSADTVSVPVLAIFDNEEVGSATKQGADSDFLEATLKKIAGQNYYTMLENSFMVSADNAHACHPNHPELSDAQNAPTLGGGVVIKFNASQRYATDGLSAAVFTKICKGAGVKLQNYYNRADIAGGGTLGSIADTRVSVPTVDIGLSQLAMHSACETASTADVCEMVKALTAFYSASLCRHGEVIEIK